MADILKAQKQLARFVERSPEWEPQGTPGLSTFAVKRGRYAAVTYSISFAPWADQWRSDVRIYSQNIQPPKSMRSAGFYDTPAQAAKGCEAIERSQYTTR